MLVLDSLINWAGVVDELDFAKRLSAWNEHGFPELGDTSGILISSTITQVRQIKDFLCCVCGMVVVLVGGGGGSFCMEIRNLSETVALFHVDCF